VRFEVLSVIKVSSEIGRLVSSMLTEVSKGRTKFSQMQTITMAVRTSDPTCSQYVPTKRHQTSTGRLGVISQRTVTFREFLNCVSNYQIFKDSMELVNRAKLQQTESE
jgi:hypothetical protein